MDDRDGAAAATATAGAKEAIETVKTLIRKECYKDASECIKMAMELYPDEYLLKKYGFGMLIISETLHYGDIYLSKSNGFFSFDCYSILHLPPSSTEAEVKKRFDELKEQVINLIKTGFPGAKLTDFLLKLANSALYQNSVRPTFDCLRKDCVLLDWPTTRSKNNKTTTSWQESYLDWKPPIYRVDATVHVQFWKKHDLNNLSPSVRQPEEKEEERPYQQAEKEEEEDEEKKEDPYLSAELRILKRKVFDEMPQNPNYTPLEKYTKKVRQGMILGLELAFTKLCEEIRNLVDVQRFWYGLDGFKEQLSQFKEMGYNVEKVIQRIHTLKRIAERERASRAVAEKFEDEVKDREAEVIKLRSRVAKLQAEIEESKDIIANRKSKIETLKKDSSDAVAKFASTANSKWGYESLMIT